MPWRNRAFVLFALAYALLAPGSSASSGRRRRACCPAGHVPRLRGHVRLPGFVTMMIYAVGLCTRRRASREARFILGAACDLTGLSRPSRAVAACLRPALASTRRRSGRRGILSFARRCCALRSTSRWPSVSAVPGAQYDMVEYRGGELPEDLYGDLDYVRARPARRTAASRDRGITDPASRPWPGAYSI